MSETASQLGKYTLRSHLATGGMAEIWLADQDGPGGFKKELVIKRILPHFVEDKLFTTMFLDEARLAAQLSHPKIAQIYELGQVDGQYFIAMEYIEGIDLDVLLHKAVAGDEPMPIAIVCKIVMDVLEALDYAHDFTNRDGEPYNLVHRDVSPHNVLVSNDGIVKLCDFGVAKAKANQTKTQPGAVKGKFAYMAPEQIQGADDLDRRADVFAVGIMFFELLAGKKPFGDELAAINAIISQPHPDVRTLRPDTPPDLVAVIDRALAKEPNDRYPDAHEMMRDIERFVRTLDDIVGDRELAQYVRDAQGLPPLTRRNSAPIRKTNPEAKIIPTGVLPATPNPAPYAADGSTEPGVSSSNTGLYIAGFVVIGLILAVVIVFVFVIVPKERPTPVDPTPKVVEVEKPAAPTKDPSLLVTAGGQRVRLRARPEADIYYKGKLVESTPFFAKLPPGTYEIEFRSHDGKYRQLEKVVITKDTKDWLVTLQ